jgi:hypothetical protein
MKKNLIRATARVTACVLVALTLLTCAVACGGGKKAGYVFKAGDVTVAVNTPAEDTISKLGTPKNYGESPSCGEFDGTDKVYTYAGFRVYTEPGKSADVINKIELTDDSVKTPEGVYVGMSTEDAKAAMKSATPTERGESLVYAADGVELNFICRDGYVTSIQYIAKK